MSLNIQWQRASLVVVDAIIVALALYVAYLLRFDNFQIPHQYESQYALVVPAFIAVRLLLFWQVNLYRGVLKYVGARELMAIFVSVTLGSALLAVANVFLVHWLPTLSTLPNPIDDPHPHFPRVPLQVLINEYVITMLAVGGVRFSRRAVLSLFSRTDSEKPARRILIVGAGDAGEAVVRQMLQATVRSFQPVAFVDDDATKQSLYIHGIPCRSRGRDW